MSKLKVNLKSFSIKPLFLSVSLILALVTQIYATTRRTIEETKSQKREIKEGTSGSFGQDAVYFCSGDSLLSPRFRM